MNNPLQQLGNIPVTASVLESLFPHIRGGSQKLRLLERDKQIIRLKKGLYVCSPEITGENPFDRIDSQSSVCPFVCFHVIGSALLWADTGRGLHQTVHDFEVCQEL